METGGDTVTVGVALTVIVTCCVAVQPFVLPVTVYVAVLGGKAVTTTPDVALRLAAGAHVYVVAPYARKVKLSPEQRLGAGGTTEITGIVLTVTRTVVLDWHIPLVPVTVYKVVTVGLAVTVAPVVALSPAAGAQV